MADKRIELGDRAAAALAQFDRLPDFEAGLDGQLARLYEGPGFSAIDKEKLLPLVERLAPAAGGAGWKKPHLHLTFNQLLAAKREQWGRPLLLGAYNWLKLHRLLEAFTVTSTELVLRYANRRPFHFDKATGALAYQQPPLPTSDGQGVPSGLRLLLDLGDLPGGTPRPLTFKLQKRRAGSGPRLYPPSAQAVATAPQVHTTLAGAVFMDGTMAGSGGIGSMLHGREGSDTAVGATLSLDLAVARVGRAVGERGLDLGGDSQRVAEFFSDRNPRNHKQHVSARRGGGRSGPGTAAEKAAERTAAAASQLGMTLPADGAAAAAPAAANQRHCYWCHALSPGTGETCAWGTFQHGGADRRVCVACGAALRRKGMVSERPAAALCPGCPGCCK